MSRQGINKVILIGYLGNDPEGRVTQGGAAVANLSIATTRSWKDQQSGERQEQTEWHRVVLFGRSAEIAQEYLRKGSQIYIEGRLQSRKWQDREGYDRTTTEIVGEVMQMLGGNGSTGGPYSAHAQVSQNSAESNHNSRSRLEEGDDSWPF